MINDKPRFYQWVLFNKTLFRKHPAKNPIYGTEEAVKKIIRKDLADYYKKYYMPNNMVISVAGNIKSISKEVKDRFKSFKKQKLQQIKKFVEPSLTNIRKRIEKKKILNSYIVLGYKAAPRASEDSYVLDLIKALLGRGQSGRIIEEIRNKGISLPEATFKP
mgnify:FL=1